MLSERALASVEFSKPGAKAERRPAAFVSKFYSGHTRWFFSVSVPLEVRQRVLAGLGLTEAEAEERPEEVARYIGRLLEAAWAELPPF